MPAHAGAAIRGVAMAVPERRVGNEEIAARIGVEPDWIVKRTGTSSRPWAVEGERVSDYASRAAALALERAGVSCLSDVTREAVSASGLGLDAVDLFVYHQANSRIIRAVGQRLGIGPERVVDYVDRFANSSTATLPIALSVAEAEAVLRPGGHGAACRVWRRVHVGRNRRSMEPVLGGRLGTYREQPIATAVAD